MGEGDGGRGFWYHQHPQHHVVVVDQKHKLLLPRGELSCHPEDKILHLHLKKRPKGGDDRSPPHTSVLGYRGPLLHPRTWSWPSSCMVRSLGIV